MADFDDDEWTLDEIRQLISNAAEEHVDLALCGSQNPLCIFLGHIDGPSRIFSVFCVMADQTFCEWAPEEPSNRHSGTLDTGTFEMVKQVLADAPTTFLGTYKGIPVCKWDWDNWSSKIGLIPVAARPLVGHLKEMHKRHYSQ